MLSFTTRTPQFKVAPHFNKFILLVYYVELQHDFIRRTCCTPHHQQLSCEYGQQRNFIVFYINLNMTCTGETICTGRCLLLYLLCISITIQCSENAVHVTVTSSNASLCSTQGCQQQRMFVTDFVVQFGCNSVRELHIILLNMNKFYENTLRKGRTFLAGLNDVTLARVPWNLMAC